MGRRRWGRVFAEGVGEIAKGGDARHISRDAIHGNSLTPEYPGKGAANCSAILSKLCAIHSVWAVGRSVAFGRGWI